MSTADDGLDTLAELIEYAVEQIGGDDLAGMACFYHSEPGVRYSGEAKGGVVRCAFADLPKHRFYSGLGMVDGHPFIGFTDRYVYVYTTYDGSEKVVAVPRHPEYVGKEIPVL